MSNKSEIKTTSSNRIQIVSGLITKKAFVKQDGEITNNYELYFRASIQDYFIKFCESEVSKKDLENYISQESVSSIQDDKVITLEIEIVDNGNWDACDNNSNEKESRVGSYIIIHKIILPNKN